MSTTDTTDTTDVGHGTVTATIGLLRHNARRDRVLVPIWLAALVLIIYASAKATDTLFTSAAERLTLASALNDQPGLRALYGPILDPSSSGELAMSKMTVLYAAFTAILYVVLVRRHTRADEETGRAELLAGGVVGRHAPMAAAVIEGAAVAAALGVLAFLANSAGGLPTTGSAAFAVTWTGTGLVATGIAALSCQLSASARTCGAIAAILVMGEFVVRAIGDAVDGSSWLAWASPLGWNTQFRAWSEPRWWVSLLYVGCATALLVAAFVLRAQRDLGSGMVHARPGRTDGSVTGPFTLLLRLQRTSLALWTAGVVVVSTLFGAMTPGFDELFSGTSGRDVVERFGGSFFAALALIAAIAVTAYPVSLVAAASHDERAGRTELVLAGVTTRLRWFAMTALLGWVSAAWLLTVSGVGLMAGVVLADGGGGSVGADAVVAAASWLPATWLVTACAVAGLAFRQAWWGAAALVSSIVLALVGELLQLPVWVTRLSPFYSAAPYPVGPWAWTPWLLTVAVASCVLLGAWAVYSRRDVS